MTVSLWQTLTDAQLDDVKSGRVRVAAQADGSIVARHVKADLAATGRSPRRAIEKLAAKS